MTWHKCMKCKNGHIGLVDGLWRCDNCGFELQLNKAEELSCLRIRSKWINLILSGQKTWAIWKKPTRKVGQTIGLLNAETQVVEGYVDIADCFEESLEELRKNKDKHRASDFIDKYAEQRKSLFVYVLKNPKKERCPHRRYSHSTGVWCKTLRLLTKESI